MYNPISTNIDTKAFHGSNGNLLSPCEGRVNIECADSLDNVGEHSNSANFSEPSEVKKEHITVSMSQQKIMCHFPYID